VEDLVPVMTVQELAQRLHITKQALWGLVRRGVVTPPIRLGDRRHVWCTDTAEGIVRARESARQEQKHTKAANLRARMARDAKRLAVLEGAGGA
jgi:hypothetical protein